MKNIIRAGAERRYVAASCRVQAGATIVISLLILSLISIMAVAMSRSFFFEEGKTGNVREKTRAFHSAQDALRQAEWLLTRPLNPEDIDSSGTKCAGTGVSAKFIICTNPNDVVVSDYAPIFKFSSTYNPGSGFSVSTNGGDGTFYAVPGWHVYHLNSWVLADGSVDYYKITAYGYGGNQNSVAIVEGAVQADSRLNEYSVSGVKKSSYVRARDGL